MLEAKMIKIIMNMDMDMNTGSQNLILKLLKHTNLILSEFNPHQDEPTYVYVSPTPFPPPQPCDPVTL